MKSTANNRTRFRWRVALTIATIAPSSDATDAAPPAGSDWRIVFADEFSGTSVDRVKWASQYEWGRTHNHDAYMLDENVIVEDGLVKLEATRESTNGKPYSSGVLSSHGTFRLSEGYIEARIKMPNTRGSWPAFWMLRQGWPPEIDIMENPLFTSNSINDRYSVNNFWPGSGPPSDFEWIGDGMPGSEIDLPDLSAEYYNYGLHLDSTGLRFYFDGQQVRFSSYKPDFQNMYLIFNYAVGGWPGAPSTAQWANGASDQTLAEWIRVYQQAPTTGSTSTWTFNSSSNGSWDAASNWSGPVPNFERHDVDLPTLAGRSAMEIRWGNSRTVGNLTLNGTTSYTFGQAGGAVESIMFADLLDNSVNLWSQSGVGGHVFNSRLDLWSDLSARNDTANPITFNGDIVGQARLQSGRLVGGALRLWGQGGFILNGNGTYQRDTHITEGVTVELNGQLYADSNALPATRVIVDQGATLVVNNLDIALGGLPGDANRLLVDDGRIRFKSGGNVTRGFTIGSGGATLEVDAGASVRIAGTETDIVNLADGGLTLAGPGTVRLQKPIGGAGGVVKSGDGDWIVTSASNNNYTGPTLVEAGRLNLLGTTGTGDTTIEPAARLDGTGTVSGNLIVGGRVDPGDSLGTLNVLGNYDQQDGATLAIEIQGTSAGMFDVLHVAGNAVVEGQLNISLLSPFAPSPGSLFPILNAASVAGGVALVGDATGFALVPTGAGLALYFGDLPAGDYDRNGIVNTADYDEWKAAFGTMPVFASTGSDGNGDGIVDAADFTVWRDHVGASIFAGGAGGASAVSLAVPEPATLLCGCLAGLIGALASVRNRCSTNDSLALRRRLS
jgi:autotransporter-associated beta strand protein